MAEATIIKAWTAGANAFIAVRVNNVEYVGSVPSSDLEGLSAADTKAALVAAAKEAYLLAQPAAAKPIAVSGTVAL